MAISLKNYYKTSHTGIYISKDKYNIGYKYVGRFQYMRKKYLRVLGYSQRDNLDELKAFSILSDMREEIKTKCEKENTHLSSSNCVEKTDLISDYAQILDHEEIIKALTKKYQQKQLAPYQVELLKLQDYLDLKNKKMIILFEGRDASGKGGAIRTLSRYMNSKHYRIVALGKPTTEEKTQWFFQRYIKQFPKAGEIILFDRSWYNRAMVEPVFGFCTKKQFNSFYEHVKPFEQNIVDDGTILIKLYYSVSKDVQSLRFKDREQDPLKQWKLSEVDLQAQGLWSTFTQKKLKMLKNTEIRQAPWHIIRSDDKFTTRLETLKIILNSVKYTDKDMKLDYSKNNDVIFSAKEEIAYMNKSN